MAGMPRARRLASRTLAFRPGISWAKAIGLVLAMPIILMIISLSTLPGLWIFILFLLIAFKWLH
jgi:hypothetical protein